MTQKHRAIWAAVFIAAAIGCGSSEPEQEMEVRRNWAIAIHGGAGHFGEEDLTAEQQAAYTASLSAALAAGEEVLQQGGNSVEAVETVIRIMEDDSLFNAGRGAVFTAEGIQELDASIADGFTRNCGAVTGIRGYRHPISVARSVMDSSEHVFFSGHGAGAFAAAMGHEPALDEWFFTEKAHKRYLRAKRRAAKTDALADKKGTVGCVALDSQGNLAAGTSTGGMTYKKHGRIGDSPIIGAGTWADN
ncbi:MAG: isoaspartyl peptidase/L-asparaginase family protein, partial [Flavobacteriales bacterium]